MSESSTTVAQKDTGDTSPTATYAFGPGGLLNTPGLGAAKPRKAKRKKGAAAVVNAMVTPKESSEDVTLKYGVLGMRRGVRNQPPPGPGQPVAAAAPAASPAPAPAPSSAPASPGHHRGGGKPKRTRTAKPKGAPKAHRGGHRGGGRHKRKEWESMEPEVKELVDRMSAAIDERIAQKAVLSGASKNDLPDSAFLYVEPGGKKDESGKTVPRTKRHFPVKHADGSPDPAHIRNALARIPQSDVPAPAKARATKRAQGLLKRVNASKESTFSVVQQKDGSYRWFSTSSNAYKDNDQEIVSTKALSDDCDRLDASGDYGPLRWWHMGDLNAGVDIGACDFNAMNGKMLIESGTFKDADVARAVMAKQKELGVSVGFTHPAGEPVGGVYEHIKRFERSLLPRASAANPYTSFDVTKETDDMATMEQKWKEFVSLVGDEAKAREYVAASTNMQKELDQAGVKHKEAQAVEQQAQLEAQAAEEQAQKEAANALPSYPSMVTLPPDAPLSAVTLKGGGKSGPAEKAAMFANMKANGSYDGKKAAGKPATTDNAKAPPAHPAKGAAPAAGASAPAAPPAPSPAMKADNPLWDGEPGAGDGGMGDGDGGEEDEGPEYDIDDIKDAILGTIAEMLQSCTKEIQAVKEQLTALETTRTKETDLATQRLMDINKRLKSLEGDADMPQQYRASRAGPVVGDGHRLKETPANIPQLDDLTRAVLGAAAGAAPAATFGAQSAEDLPHPVTQTTQGFLR